MALNIPPDFERAVLERVATGEYGNTDDVLYACISALDDLEHEEPDTAAALRARIERRGLAAGEKIPGGHSGAVTITGEVREIVLGRIASGGYGSIDHYLTTSLAALDREEEEDARKLDGLRRDVERGFQQIERGEYATAEEVYLRLRAKLDAKERV
jgi:Arc/MetJ-type ribon-helix-helix transcriptional regulator